MDPQAPKCVSPLINSSNSNLTLIASDGVRFLADQDTLRTSSSVFADMISMGAPSLRSETVEVAEDSETLKNMLLCCYSESAEGSVGENLSVEACLKLAEAGQKYNIHAVMLRVERALLLCLDEIRVKNKPSMSGSSSDNLPALRIFDYAFRHGAEGLGRTAAILLLKSDPYQTVRNTVVTPRAWAQLVRKPPQFAVYLFTKHTTFRDAKAAFLVSRRSENSRALVAILARPDSLAWENSCKTHPSIGVVAAWRHALYGHITGKNAAFPLSYPFNTQCGKPCGNWWLNVSIAIKTIRLPEDVFSPYKTSQ